MKRPRWMKNHVACPECGHIYPEPGALAAVTTFAKDRYDNSYAVAMDCPVCKAHFTDADFWRENQDKWDRTHKVL